MGTQDFPVTTGNEEPKQLSRAAHESVDMTAPQTVGQTAMRGPIGRHLVLADRPRHASMAMRLGVSGSGTLRGTYSFDFDQGIEPTTFATADVWWEQQTEINRQLVPRDGAALANLGIIDYDGLTYADLVRLPFSSIPLTANAEGTNFLVTGATFAVKTRTGKFVKVQVLRYGYNLKLRWQECTPPAGSGTLRGTYSFDFDQGAEAATQETADVWWQRQTEINRQLVPRNGAALASLGIIDYDGLTYADLVRLPFSSIPLTANAQGTNFLVTGATFAVKTRTGKFVKVHVLNYGYNLNLRWQECAPPPRYADVTATLGSTPEWLVTRYEVSCSYQTNAGPRNCGSGTFDHQGGTVRGRVSNEFGPFPATINVTVIIDFQPDTGLQGIVRTFTPLVMDTGVNFLFEPYQVMQRTEVLFDLGHSPKPEDYLLLRWKHIANGVPVTSGHRFINAAELAAEPVTRYEILFVPDPLEAESLDVSIEGRFQGHPLIPFAQTFELTDRAILFKSEKIQSEQFMLVAT
ncbi:hypothetical protein PYH37_006337 (plasmid) [Sinorhizobium numidicum]|uniref:Uncharacterized protein n=1 Tax=Sinorhizobium numidicum TaxID=680248 RepID=A0ABY8D7X4_9HYPH|nr:hypothetical protein [Sinorhizobium numidicum]WEX79429.1 hypothetical protein PYH37_006337 [Sinorhizobium numidicum]WEX85615.1 hypothetical protein PYH38_006047 [Sinorhizobium numidicum]